MNIKEQYKHYLLIAFVGFLFFVPYLGHVHLFDWDEINFAEAAREMIATGDYSTVRINYQPFHEKPPLFIWMQVVSMKIFGINEFAARFPNAVIGIITLIIIYSIGRKLYDYRFGILWVLSYLGSLLPHFYFRSGIIDPVFNLFIFLGIYYLHKQLSQYLTTKKNKYSLSFIAGVFVSFAVLTKGPVGYLLAALVFFTMMFLHRKEIKLSINHFLMFSIVAFIPAIIWYLFILPQSGANVLEEFVRYQIKLFSTEDAGHGGPFYFHFVVLLAGCFPASIIMLRAFRKNSEDKPEQIQFRKWMITLLSVVLVIFSIVETKIVHYSSLAYFPITFLSALAVHRLIYKNMEWKNSTSWLIGIIGGILALLFICLPLVLMNIDLLLPRIKDVFTKEVLMANAGWYGFEYIPGILFLTGIIATLILFKLRKYLTGFLTLFSATAFMIFIFLVAIAPRIEAYTQAAPIEFFTKLQDKNCYIHVLGYKSYAHYFYGKMRPSQTAQCKGMSSEDFENWLLKGEKDKPAFFVCKINNAKKYLLNPGMKYLYTKNGFVFMCR